MKRCRRSGLGGVRWALAVVLACAGCTKRDTPPVDAAKTDAPVRIGVSLLTMQHQFYQELRAGLEAEAKKHDYQLLVVSAEFDAARQADQINEFLAQDVNAIVLCPADSRSVGASVLAANEAHVPIVTADIASASPLGKVAAHIASDNVAGGREAGRLMVEAIGGSGKVAILSHPEVSSVTDRVKGFREELASHPEIEIVAELAAEGRRDRAVSVMEDVLQRHPELAGVFGINDDSALGALAAVEASGRAGKVAIVGYDATPEARQHIAAGDIFGDVIQYPTRIGELTISTLHDLLNGEDVPAIVPVEVGRYTRESAQDG
ncbi:MAG: substrate-binding domain-containing protein [Phycisphaerales bacterium]|nr:substrate-binding domain-containing protein [Phycisphaerales bacterium]